MFYQHKVRDFIKSRSFGVNMFCTTLFFSPTIIGFIFCFSTSFHHFQNLYSLSNYDVLFSKFMFQNYDVDLLTLLLFSLLFTSV